MNNKAIIHEILNSTLTGMESNRGAVDKLKYLSRLPFHTLQIVNLGFKDVSKYIKDLNLEKLRERNTYLALQCDL